MLSTVADLGAMYILMKLFARIITFVLLAALATGTFVHAASATAMTVKMALAGAGGMDMIGCEDCGSGGNDSDLGTSCDIVCVTPLMATVCAGKILLPPVVAPAVADGAYDVVGRNELPDPDPPRTLILS